MDHRRNGAVGHVEHGVFDLLVTAVLADWLNHPLRTGAGASSENCLARAAEFLRLGRRLSLQIAGFLRTGDRDRATRTASPYSVSYSLTNSSRETLSPSPANFRNASVGQI